MALNDIAGVAERLRRQDKRIVFSNGCFDLIHAGHARYLEEAKGLGDVLIIGLNSDASVKRLKGERRPIIPETERGVVLAALEAVDYVVVFEQDTPYELIELIQPDILVKGGDWEISQIVGADLVLSKGGRVHNLCFQEGVSTSAIIERINMLNKDHS